MRMSIIISKESIAICFPWIPHCRSSRIPNHRMMLGYLMNYTNNNAQWKPNNTNRTFLFSLDVACRFRSHIHMCVRTCRSADAQWRPHFSLWCPRGAPMVAWRASEKLLLNIFSAFLASSFRKSLVRFAGFRFGWGASPSGWMYACNVMTIGSGIRWLAGGVILTSRSARAVVYDQLNHWLQLPWRGAALWLPVGSRQPDWTG